MPDTPTTPAGDPARADAMADAFTVDELCAVVDVIDAYAAMVPHIAEEDGTGRPARNMGHLTPLRPTLFLAAAKRHGRDNGRLT